MCHAARFVAKCSQNTEKTKGKHSLYLPLLYQLLIVGGIADIPKTEHVTTPPKFKTLDQTPKIAFFELLSSGCRMGVSVAIFVVLLPCVAIVPLLLCRFKNYFILKELCVFCARTLTRGNSWERMETGSITHAELAHHFASSRPPTPSPSPCASPNNAARTESPTSPPRG